MKLKKLLTESCDREICKRGLLLEGWNTTGMTTGSSVRRGENALVRNEGEREWALDLGLKTSGVLQAWPQNPEWTHDPTAGLWAPAGSGALACRAGELELGRGSGSKLGQTLRGIPLSAFCLPQMQTPELIPPALQSPSNLKKSLN